MDDQSLKDNWITVTGRMPQRNHSVFVTLACSNCAKILAKGPHYSCTDWHMMALAIECTDCEGKAQAKP